MVAKCPSTEEEAITTYRTNNSKNKRKLVEILSQFNATSKEQHQKFYKEAWMGEKEKERNVNIIQENIEFILSGCRVKLENSCSEATMVAYTEIVCHLERLDPAMIKPEVPLASAFPQGEMSIESRRILMAVFDLLEGFLRPLLTEDDYSENSYVIHAVSK
ncbi:12181_t:CDS:2, partial [Dentiscutata heterogama]